MSHYTRAQRRELAKALNMVPKNESPQQWRERIRRSQEAGRQIDRQFKNNCETNVRNAAAEAEARQLNFLTEKLGAERANEIMSNNRAVTDARAKKLAERKVKQKAAYQAKN